MSKTVKIENQFILTEQQKIDLDQENKICMTNDDFRTLWGEKYILKAPFQLINGRPDYHRFTVCTLSTQDCEKIIAQKKSLPKNLRHLIFENFIGDCHVVRNVIRALGKTTNLTTITIAKGSTISTILSQSDKKILCSTQKTYFPKTVTTVISHDSSFSGIRLLIRKSTAMTVILGLSYGENTETGKEGKMTVIRLP